MFGIIMMDNYGLVVKTSVTSEQRIILIVL